MQSITAGLELSRPEGRGRVLVVDDEAVVARLCARCLRMVGFEAELVANGEEALRALRTGTFDVVLSDVAMPVLDGLSLSRMIARDEIGVPIVLMTALPLTPREAIESRAVGFLTKPLDLRDLTETVASAIELGTRRKAERAVIAVHKSAAEARAALNARFDEALEGLFMVQQPIVNVLTHATLAYESLVRVDQRLFRHPGELFEAAEDLGRVHDLGRRIRARIAAELHELPKGVLSFINLHPLDLLDEQLYDKSSPLAPWANRIVLEVTERASLEDVKDLQERLERLRVLGYRIAVDDLGAGFAGLSAFAEIEPEVVKLDGSLVRNIDRMETKQRIVASVIAAAAELGTIVVAECVETQAERDLLISLGCTYLQGYLFAKPAAGFQSSKF